MTLVTLKQVTTYCWQLVSPKGHIILDDLSFGDLYKAEQWVKSYVTSFPCWDYVIVTINKEVQNKLLKSVSKKRYDVGLYEKPTGAYVIVFEDTANETTHASEIIQDYNMASFMFDLKVQDLEGC